MRHHTKLYYTKMGYDETDWIGCEIVGCLETGSWIHHIDCRGMGGSKRKDYIENLMSICAHHDFKYGDRKLYMDFLKYCHQKRLEERQVQFNPELIKNDFK